MPAPTRAQIVADITLPTFTVEVYTGGIWVAITSLVKAARANVEAGDGVASGVSMGPAVAPEASLELDRSARSYEADRLPVRIAFGFADSTLLTRFSGILMDMRGSGRAATRSWELRGWDAHIEGCEVRSFALRRRQIFTQTTASSVENPALSTWRGGLGNYILWQCGGRPYEQALLYPSALFYYACSEALIGPEWTWIAGDNPWEVLRRLCRSAGGQVYQDGEGTVRYVDPITLATGTPAFTFTDEVLTQAQRAAQGKAGYSDIAEERDSTKAITGATCAYVSRLVQGAQQVYEDTIPRQIAAGAALVLTCDTQLPLYSVTGVAMDGCVIRTAVATTPATATIAYVHQSAQRVIVTITNTLSEPIMVYAMRVSGRPIAAGEEGSASYLATTGRIVTVEDSPYVQSERHAQMLCRMIYDAEITGSMSYQLSGCAYDPDRVVGEVVGLTCADFGLSALRCRVVRIDTDGGAWMDVLLAPLGSLPTRTSVHLIGSVSGTKELAY